jgi:hypothetical protein
MPPDENLTPEEKLLRVIQGKDQDSSPPGDSEEVPVVPVEESAPEIPEPPSEVSEPQPAEIEVAQEESLPAEPVQEEVAQTPEPEEPPESEQPEPEEAAEPEAEEPEVEEEPEDAKPKLRLATAPAEGKEAPVIEEAASAEAGEDDIAAAGQEETTEEEESPVAAAAASTATAGTMVAPGMKYEERKTGFRTANRLLMAAVVLILALVGFEIWANITAKPMPPPEDMGTSEIRDVIQSELPPITDILAIVDGKIFPGEEPIVSTNTTTTVTTAQSEGWARKNIKLAGIAQLTEEEREAIVMDKGVGKVHFLRVGDTMLANGVEFKITRIESKKVAITDGSGEIWLE